MSGISTESLAEVFVLVADTLVDDFDVVEFLQMVTAQAADISGSTAAGLLLADARNELQFMAASEESARLLELFALQSHDGPCVECFRDGIPVVNTDLDQAGARWPAFAPEAVAAGFRSVHAFPLRHQRSVIGALNLFSTEAGQLDEADVRIIQALADVATIGLLQERAIHRGELLTEQLQSALNSRITVEQAKGALARMRGIDVDGAFVLIREYSRRHQRRLVEVAQDIVTDPSRHPELTLAKTTQDAGPGRPRPVGRAIGEPG